MSTISISAQAEPIKLPTVGITVNKNLRKVYSGNQIFLKDGEEYAIQLFNPRSKKVKVEISVDGISVTGPGLVLQNGESCLLERYVNEARKFKFSTYKVEDTSEVREAIKDNGKVIAKFYEESEPYNYFVNFYPFPYFGATTGDGEWLNFSTKNISSNVQCSYNATQDSLIETGRTEKGNRSNQKFDKDYSDFNYYPFHTVELNLLPESHKKPITVSEIKIYCTGCGQRIRSPKWRYCAGCGEEIK